MIWAFILLMAIAAMATLLFPLLRNSLGQTQRSKFDLAVYLDQLREIDDEVGRGSISAEDAETARREIKRRMIAVQQDAPSATPAAGRSLPVALAVAIPLVALGLYSILGEPSLPGHEFAAATQSQQTSAEGSQMLSDVETMTVALAKRLEKEPDDAKGWRMLGWSYFSIEKYPEAVKAYARAVSLAPKDSSLRSAYGEAVVRAAGGFVTADAKRIMDETLALDPKDPRARFFRGLALEQANKHREALDLWLSIARDGPADADWMPGLRDRVREVAAKLKVDAEKLLPPQPAISAASTQAQPVPATSTDLEKLEKRLEESPRDYQGWIALARAYKAQGQTQIARASLARARELFADAPFVMGELAKVTDELDTSDRVSGAPPQGAGPDQTQIDAAAQLDPQARQAMIDNMVDGLARKLETDPHNLDGWIMLARSRKVLGDPAAADKALARARQVFAGDRQALDKLANAAHELGLAVN